MNRDGFSLLELGSIMQIPLHSTGYKKWDCPTRSGILCSSLKNGIQNAHFGDVWTATNEAGEPLFCLADVCKAVSLTNPSSVASRLGDDEIVKYDLGRDNHVVGNSIANYITAGGFYNVILLAAVQTLIYSVNGSPQMFSQPSARLEGLFPPLRGWAD